MRVLGAVDIGGTKIAAGAVTEHGEILSRFEAPTDPEKGFQSAMRRTREMLREAERRAGAGFTGIGVGCTGPVDPFTGVIGDVGNLPGWMGGNLVEELEGEFAVKAVVENDADAAALAELAWGAARGCNRFIYITVSTGIGGAMIFDGRLYRGAGGAHPEPGHQMIDASGPLCYCGARGCWEVLAAGPALSHWMEQQRPGAGLSPARICELARQGDALALRAVEREARYLGLGLANMVTLFAPEAIALGGGVMKSADLFLDPARAVIREICTQVPAARTELRLAALCADTGLKGAARAWIHRYH